MSCYDYSDYTNWDDGLVEVANLDTSEGYEWSNFVVWYAPDDECFYWLGDSGCSCNGFADSITRREQLNKGTYFEALAALSQEAEEMSGRDYRRLSPAEGVRQIERLANFRVEAS